MAYLKGLIAKPKHEKAPSFVVCRLSIHREDLIASLQLQKDEWINVDVKQGQDPTKLTTIINEWKPNSTPKPAAVELTEDAMDYPVEEINPDEIPF